MTDAVFGVNDALQLSEEMDCEEMTKLVANLGAKIPQGRLLLNKSLHVSKLTIAPVSGG